jgi:hypothetical protein
LAVVDAPPVKSGATINLEIQQRVVAFATLLVKVLRSLLGKGAMTKKIEQKLA